MDKKEFVDLYLKSVPASQRVPAMESGAGLLYDTIGIGEAEMTPERARGYFSALDIGRLCGRSEELAGIL